MNNGRTRRPFSGKKGIEEALKRLNAKMVYAGMEPVELVSCGGASLNLLGWVSRSTSDVDIICAARVGAKGKVTLQPDETLPPQFTEFVAEVGRELNLKPEWLNFGPAPLVAFGLPPGLERRLKRKSFGRCLALHLISRLDQIHLKIYATMDPKTRLETHLGDLLDLEPTEAEAQAAVEWLLSRKTSGAFRRKLKQVLDRIGHEKLAQKLQD
jgi:hypothetical protein